jgi:hypothetical protein
VIPRISERTSFELAHPAAPGQRHDQLVRIACSLRQNGFSSEAIFVQLCVSQPEIPRREVAAIVRWVEQRVSGARVTRGKNPLRRLREPHPISPAEAKGNVERFLGATRVDDADLWELSPWRPLEDWRFDALPLLAALYGGDELINIVTEFTDREGKLLPRGAGETRYRDDWMRWIRNGVSQSEAGAWIRMNPVKSERGTGMNGACRDADVTAYRFILLEADGVELSLQLSLLAKIKLPIAAIILSGNRSAHAWIKVDAPDERAYRHQTTTLFERLRVFGIDESNRNPSRLSRLPGATRRLADLQVRRQKLLYLNPEPPADRSIV